MSLKLMSAVSLSFSPHVSKSNDSEKLLKQLLECVQDCQKRYGGKTELATEFDSCVAGLCLSFEAIFLHGLRIKSLNSSEQSSAIKQVSEIVANSFGSSNDNPSFWPFIKKHLTKHEEERYESLKHIWTETGRGRAWIRSTLNEHSLERYIHIALSNSKLLNEYYETWAILRDDEKSSMLPNMAAGLCSILFAISIDKPELNVGMVQKNSQLFHVKGKIEPIIQAPAFPVNEVKSNKKRRKVARQYISFDDNDSSLSTSVPSSSSSSASDISSIDTSKNKIKDSLKSIEEDNHNKPRKKIMDTKENQGISEPQRKLSVETSGSREKFPSVVPEILTPVNNEIGELTPVSLETNTNFGSPDNSDEILEIPTDISAVITALEDKNNEELRKKDDKIRSVLKENEFLQEQIKKYVGAIQMLRKGDGSDLNNVLDELKLEDHPDYKSEAKLFEKKLIQVAEMHAELIDFNTVLQQKLSEKEFLVEKLRSELEVLAGPLPRSDEDLDTNKCNVNIWIPSAFLTGTGSNSHHVYQIFLRAGNDEWNIYRRYAEFHALHTDLKKLDPVVVTFDFPPKKRIKKKDSATVEDRRKRLQNYLRRILIHWPELSQCSSRNLLEQHLSFFKNHQDDQQSNKGIFSSRRYTGPNSNTYTGL